MQWVVVIDIYFVEKAERGYVSTMIQIIITISPQRQSRTRGSDLEGAVPQC